VTRDIILASFLLASVVMVFLVVMLTELVRLK
jgi:hypothetical protein